MTRSLLRLVAAAVAERVRSSAERARGFWQRRPAPGRLAAFAFAALLAIAGAGGLGLQLALPTLLPSSLDWKAVGVLLEREARRGDAVLTSPAWAERIRQVAPRGLRVLVLPRFTPAALEGVRRVWLLSLHGAPGFSWQPELELSTHSAIPDPPLAVGKIQVLRFEISHPDLPIVTLGERLAGATVTLQGRPCTAERAGFRCAGDRSRATVTAGMVEVDGVPRPCVLARLDGEAAPLRVTLPGVPVGRVLRGSAGLAGDDAGAGPVTPLTVAVRVEGEEAAAVQLEGGGWPRFRVDTSRWAGERHAVSLEVVVPADRAICLQAVTLP